jgi:hypothetical protein
LTCRVRRQSLHKVKRSMKAHLERADGDIETEWEKNYGDEKDNWAQVGTNGTRYSQDGAEGGTHCPQDGTEDGTRCPQDGAKA